MSITVSQGVAYPGGPLNSITRTALITLAEANGLTPGVTYLTSDGLLCMALSSRFLQPLGPWFIDGRTWSVGSATSATDLTYCYLPPLAPNAQVDVYHQWKYDNTNVTKRGRIYVDGTLGGGVSGAQALWVRALNDASLNVQANIYTRMTNVNDASVQQLMTTGDTASFGTSTSALQSGAVSTNTSKLLRAMGETSKTGSNVTISALTHTGTTANATSVAHGLLTGDYIGVTGATGTGSTQYNADPVQITKISADAFTYAMSSDPGADASGSPVFQKYVSLSLVAFRVMINQGLGF